MNEEDNAPLTDDEHKQMSATVARQLKDPALVLKCHIKKSNIWQATQLIRKIQRELVEGYSFDKDSLTMLVNSMFGFINGIVDPSRMAQSATETTEQIQ